MDGDQAPVVQNVDVGVVVDIEVREAIAEDLAALTQLVEEFESEIGSEKGGDVWLRLHRRPLPLVASLADSVRVGTDRHSQSWVAVATIDDVVVGFASAHLRLVPDGVPHGADVALLVPDGADTDPNALQVRAGPIGELTELMVTSGARGVGVGRALLNSVVDRCVRHGCAGVDAVALPGARITKNFFEAAHFTARAIVVHHRLRP